MANKYTISFPHTHSRPVQTRLRANMYLKLKATWSRQLGFAKNNNVGTLKWIFLQSTGNRTFCLKIMLWYYLKSNFNGHWLNCLTCVSSSLFRTPALSRCRCRSKSFWWRSIFRLLTSAANLFISFSEFSWKSSLLRRLASRLANWTVIFNQSDEKP